MNRILKNVHVAFSTLFFILGAAFVATKEESVPLHFQIQNEFGKQNISLFEAEDGNCYVFLPSYSELDKVQFILPPGQVFCLDDTRMSEKMTCEDFELEKPYAFSVDGEHVADLWFYQSRNVATMYIDTATGEMTEIHDDKTHEEYASMTIYTVDGKIDHFDSRCKIKGRGNSTWTQDKRPYLLTLSSDESLLNMGSAQKWVLLANAYDETNMNNKLVFDLASQVKFKWSPDSRFVDLYLNGEYSGLYLLAEKVEVHPNRLNIDISSGDFLCKVDTPSRIEQLKDYFKSSLGRIIEICTPNTPSDLEFDYIMHQIFLLEQELVSGTDLTVSEIVDLDSWIRRYLIDEISGNIDSDLTSSYFYLFEGKFYAGPVWDYDMAFGNSYKNQEAWSFLAKNAFKRNNRPSPYYKALYTNESFYNRMIEIYRTEFVPILENMIGQDLNTQLDRIQYASRMNSIRWQSMYDEWKQINDGMEIVQNRDGLIRYFVRRVSFLNSAWLEGKDYCTVQFESVPGNSYWNISIEKGDILETTYMDLVNTIWLDTKTGLPVDFLRPITEDMVVSRKIPEEISAE